ncbi:MAG: serine/threonine protein kinase [Deltaproteobacteria bacterium]|nr:serine/threonine protein kinase [Deltaproteobacteria bacterium]
MAVIARPEIPGYDLRRRIGEGASAVVYEALEQRTGRAVAMKILRDELLAEPTARQRFHREARALMCVVHPNVAAVFDYSGPDEERVFIAMELFDGKSLKELIEARGHLPDDVAAAIFMQVFSALTAAHGERLLHRDLSATNIVVTASGRAVVTDFGLVASVVGTRTSETFATRAANLVGTPLYYAPELLLSGTYSELSDLYAGGICLTYALLGHPPAPTAEVGALLAAVLDGKLERVLKSNITVDPSLGKIADALTDPSPTKRPQRAGEVAASLAAFLRQRKIDGEAAVRRWLGPDTQVAELQSTQPMSDAFEALRVASKGRFVVEALIGQGGMAKVFRAQDTRLNRPVAVKLMHEDADQTMRMRFHREARALARVRHPNVIEVIDYSGPDKPLPYIVMELVEGATLEAVTTVKPMPETAAIAAAVGICEGLEAVHREGFVHRDVKPENVFVDDQGRVLLADFGIVRPAQGDKTGTFVARPTASIGSPLFASPEQLFDPDNAGPRSDLFSLASLLFYLLTGRAPVAEGSVGDALADLMDGKIEKLPASYGPELRALMDRLHARDPSKRPQSAEVVSAELRAMLAAKKVMDPRAELRAFLGKSGGVTRITQQFSTQTVTDARARSEALADQTEIRRTSIITTPQGAAPASVPARRRRGSPVIALAAGVFAIVCAVAVALALNRPTRPAPVVVPVSDLPPELPAPPPVDLAPPVDVAPVPVPAPVPDPVDAPKPRPAANEPGVLRFFTKPWAKISIGGKLYGTTPLFNTLELPPGRYVVRFENPAYRTVEKKVDLKGGERREIHVTLEKP